MPDSASDSYHLLLLHHLFLGKPRQLRKLLTQYGTAREALESHELQVEPVPDAVKCAVEEDMKWLAREEHHLVSLFDADYPQKLRETYDPPNVMYAKGDRQYLEQTQNCVAMVGARKASQYGLQQAGLIAEKLANQGVCVVSGLALGIDAACHEGALNGQGLTIAVLGTGLDEVYPRRNWRLAERICNHGLLLSEFPCRTKPYPANFPQRNRIVTGLSLATVVIEAAIRSGSLVSARLALNEGREVMALPGQVHHRQSRGCHQLIKEGAHLIESGDEVLELLGLKPDEASLELHLGAYQSLTPEQKQLLELLAVEPLSLDQLAAIMHLSAEELTVSLVSLEVLGILGQNAGRYERLDQN